MAEQFIIRIQADGQTSRTGSSGSGNSAALGAAAAAGIATRELTPKQRIRLQNSSESFINEQLTQKVGYEGYFAADISKNRLLDKRAFSSTYGVPITGVSEETEAEAMGMQAQIVTKEVGFDIRGGYVNDFVKRNQNKMKTAGLALSLKSANAYISYKQHRSGNTYYNNQLNNGMRLAQYGLALGYGAAKGGPAGLALVAAGIAVNEGINFATQNANFNYDRMMDTLYVHNIKQVAGDISYGRRRRGDR